MVNIFFDSTYFKVAAYKNWQEGDNFFNQFNFFNLLQQEKYFEVIFLGINLLSNLQRLDRKAYSNIHKGTPFYWMGMASYLSHDFVTATYFFDAAVSEDINNKTTKELKSSPSILFALLNDDIPEQAARGLVSATIQRIEEFIKIYNDPLLNNSQINLNLIRNSLLEKSIARRDHPWRNLSTSFISFFLEWDYRQILLNLREQEGSNESFFVHLFKGCLLFESLLKENPKKPLENHIKTLNKALEYLQNDLRISKENTKISNTTLPKILTELRSIHDEVPKYIEITGKLRNTLGHNLVWNTHLNPVDYQILFTCISISCLHSINILYQI